MKNSVTTFTKLIQEVVWTAMEIFPANTEAREMTPAIIVPSQIKTIQSNK